MRSRSLQWIVPGAAVLLSIGACREAGQTGTGQQTSAQAQDSVQQAQNAMLQAQKDSLFDAAKSLFAAMSSIDSAASLAGYKPKKGQSEPVGKYEDQVRDRTIQALQRLRTVESRLKTSLNSIKTLNGDNKELRDQIASLQETATAMQLQISSQQARVDTLMNQLAIANTRNDSLSGSNKQLATRVDSMVTESQKVYVVSGTREYLLKNNIVGEVGGSRFPFIVKVGERLRPSNLQPDRSLFKSFDMFQQQTIQLDSNKRYEVVSTQDLTGADRTNAKGRIFTGPIHITNPRQFWAASPYLILREL